MLGIEETFQPSSYAVNFFQRLKQNFHLGQAPKGKFSSIILFFNASADFS